MLRTGAFTFLLLTSLATTDAFACKCAGWDDGESGPSVRPSIYENEVVFRATVKRHYADSNPWRRSPILIEVEVLETLKGDAPKTKLVRIGGTGSCNPRLDQFSVGSTWTFGVAPTRARDRELLKKHLPDLPNSDFQMSKCSPYAIDSTGREASVGL